MSINIRSAFIKEDFEQFKNKINARPDSCVTEEKVKAAYLNISGARDHKINAAQKRIKEIEATGIKICKLTPGELQELGIYLQAPHTVSDFHGWSDELKKMESKRSQLLDSKEAAFCSAPFMGVVIVALTVFLAGFVLPYVATTAGFIVLGVLGGAILLGFGLMLGGCIVGIFIEKKITELDEKINPLKEQFIQQEKEFAKNISAELRSRRQRDQTSLSEILKLDRAQVVDEKKAVR